MDRRDFLKASTLTFLAAGFAPFLVGNTGATANDLDRATFTPLLDTWFRVDAGGAGSLALVAISDGPPSRDLEQFTLRFRGSAGQPLEDGLYELRSERGDTYTLFLQSAGVDESNAAYAAAFSLVRPLSVSSCGRA
jgi:hypothetical protein